MISLIAAVAKNLAIGNKGQLLWHLPEDMRYFRETTRGKPVIMGRKTWESLPESFRPLPGRRNIVISRNPAYDAAGATLVGSLEEAIRQCDTGEKIGEEIFVIGGADIYRQALPLAHRLYLTEVTHDFEGDAFFPDYRTADWTEVSRSAQKNKSGIEFTFAVYHRA